MAAETPLWKTHDISQQMQDKIELLPNVERAFVHVDYETSHTPVTFTFDRFLAGQVMLIIQLHRNIVRSHETGINELSQQCTICSWVMFHETMQTLLHTRRQCCTLRVDRTD